jgi:anti-sigma factor RsiW
MLSSLALDGELDALREREFRRHLRECAACASAVADYKTLTSLLRGSARAVPERPLELRPPRRRVVIRSLLLAAAALTLAAAAGLTGLGGSSDSAVRAHKTPAFVSNIVAVSASDPDRLSVLSHRVGV